MRLVEILLTGSIVLAAVAYVVWALAPRGMRERVGALAGQWASSGAMPPALRERLARFAIAQTRPSGCGACGHRAPPSATPRAPHDRAQRRTTRVGRT
jgi:hypothetical protein